MISKTNIFVILSFFAGLSLMFIFNRQAINLLSKEKNKCEAEKIQIDNAKSPTTKPLTKQEIYLLADKAKKMEEYQPQKLYFSSKITKTKSDLITVDVIIEGNKESLFDAADLRIDFTEGIRILDVKKGTAFSSYPQISVKGASILVTGIASVTNQGIDYGKVGEPYITIQVKQLQKTGKMTINKENTNVYLMGETIFDKENTKYEVL